jgi:hypothetical protein
MTNQPTGVHGRYMSLHRFNKTILIKYTQDNKQMYVIIIRFDQTILIEYLNPNWRCMST